MRTPEEQIRYAASITPSPRQLVWQQLEFYAFTHFGMNTFTNREWGDGTEDPALFNPDALDADQWVAAVKSAGMKALILTCKQHDGFCLWPSAYTEHSVKNSPWKDGKGDVVREVSDACRRGGIKFGVYLSPWDRHDARYGQGKPYDDYFVSQLTELATNYGDIFCFWFDGACGEGKNGKKQIYDWERYYAVLRKLQANAVLNVCGPDVRWCGNEAGHCRKAEWSVVPAELRDAERKKCNVNDLVERFGVSRRTISSDIVYLSQHYTEYRIRLVLNRNAVWHSEHIVHLVHLAPFVFVHSGKNPLFTFLQIRYDSILVFYLFSYLFVRDLPVQGNPV